MGDFCDKHIQGAKKAGRFQAVEKVIRDAGRVGACLFKNTVWTSRKNNTQKALQMLPLDLFIYDVIFEDVKIFGDLRSYTYQPFSDAFNESCDCATYMWSSSSDHALAQQHTVSSSVPSVVNLTALQDELANCEDDDRQQLQSWIDRVRADGREIHVGNSFFSWYMEDYKRIDDIGRLYASWKSSQSTRRSNRKASWKHLPVWEWDMSVAAFARLIWEVSKLTTPADVQDRFWLIILCIDNVAEWRTGISKYYGITEDQAKIMLTRLIYPRARCIPNAEWEAGAGDKGSHLLPCLLELRHQLRDAVLLLSSKSLKYQHISRSPQVLSAESPESTTIALFLQDSENQALDMCY